MDGLSFPLEFGQLKAHVDFLDLGDCTTQVRGALLSLGLCAHPGGASCFRIAAPGEGSVVYVTDNELSAMDTAGQGRRDALVELCTGADLLIHDAQYLPEEMPRHGNWGHSSYDDVVDLAGDACVKRLLLSHHDPNRTDEQVDEIQWRAQEYAGARGFSFPVEAAREGMALAI
jgi:ribonuclease BN (tRNA processing enzyme)